MSQPSEEQTFYAAVDQAGKPCFVMFEPHELAAHPELATDPEARQRYLKDVVFGSPTLPPAK